MDKDKTDIIDMLTQLKKELPEEKVYAPVIPSREIEYLPSSALRNTTDSFLSSNISGDKTLHKSSNMASQEAIDWANKTRRRNVKLNAKARLRELRRIVDQLTGDEKKKVLEEIAKSKDIIKELADPTRPKNYLKPKSSLKSKALKAIPFIGPAIGVGLAALSGDANAASALPILNEADSLGPERGSEDYEIENPQANPELRKAALQKLMGR